MKTRHNLSRNVEFNISVHTMEKAQEVCEIKCDRPSTVRTVWKSGYRLRGSGAYGVGIVLNPYPANVEKMASS